MRKNMMIAALAAALVTRECSWFNVCRWDQQIALWSGFFVVLLFFCLFCEEKAEKWQIRRERVDRLRRIINRTIEIRRAG